MENFNYSGKYLTVKGKTINLDNKPLRLISIDDLLLIIFEERINPNKAYDNVIAVDMLSGKIKWKVEKFLDPREETKSYKSLGPYLNAIPGDKNYIILIKEYGWQVPVNRENGEIIKDLNLNEGRRPW